MEDRRCRADRLRPNRDPLPDRCSPCRSLPPLTGWPKSNISTSTRVPSATLFTVIAVKQPEEGDVEGAIQTANLHGADGDATDALESVRAFAAVAVAAIISPPKRDDRRLTVIDPSLDHRESRMIRDTTIPPGVRSRRQSRPRSNRSPTRGPSPTAQPFSAGTAQRRR